MVYNNLLEACVFVNISYKYQA